jgi:hypothetical protein
MRTEDTQHRCRVSVMHADKRWSVKAQTDLSAAGGKVGWMESANCSWQLSRLQLHAQAAYFHTPDYATRIYAYERGMLYGFSFPAYDGEGIRYALLLKASLTPKLSLLGKVGTTNYFDRSCIGSGLQQISHSSMTDVEIQLKWRL